MKSTFSVIFKIQKKNYFFSKINFFFFYFYFFFKYLVVSKYDESCTVSHAIEA